MPVVNTSQKLSADLVTVFYEEPAQPRCCYQVAGKARVVTKRDFLRLDMIARVVRLALTSMSEPVMNIKIRYECSFNSLFLKMMSMRARRVR